jgi:tetratricopeptide (TPR) repeat protein
MRILAWAVACALASSFTYSAAAQTQSVTKAATPAALADLIREIGSDEELDADMTRVLGFTANQRGTWSNRQLGAFDREADPTSVLHVYAIQDAPGSDVLIYTRRGAVVHFIRADANGKASNAIAFDNDAGKRLGFSTADAQAEIEAELAFWNKSGEKVRNWWYCEAELGGSHPVQPDAKIAGCQWVAEHEKNDRRAVSRAYTNLGSAYGGREGKDEKKQMEYMNAAVKVDPTNDNAWAQLCSVQNWVAHDTQAALASCTKVIELAPKSAEGWTYRGDIYLRDKKFEQAISDYNHALELAPQWMWPWDNRGEAYLRMGKTYQAILDFNEVIKTGPGYAMGYIDRGIAHLKLNDVDAAKVDFEAGLKIDPKCGSCMVGRGLVEAQVGNKAASEADIANGKKLDPKVAEFFEDDGITIP